MTTVRALAPLTAALFLTGCDFGDWAEHGNANAYKTDFHESRPLKSGSTLAVENYNGSVEISVWDDEKVDITGTKYGATEDLRDRIKIEIENTASGLRIRTIRPDAERRGATGAKYVIKVPRKTKLDTIASSNGSLRITGVEGDARLRTSNASVETLDIKGAIEIQTSNGRIRSERVTGAYTARTSNSGIRADIEATPTPVRAETSNGSVELSFTKPPTQDVSADTSNASITIGLPSGSNARLRARTSNGSVTTEHELQVTSGTLGKSRVEGTIGSGGPVIDLDSSNGRIRVERR